jgi:hypothetical protein
MLASMQNPPASTAEPPTLRCTRRGWRPLLHSPDSGSESRADRAAPIHARCPRAGCAYPCGTALRLTARPRPRQQRGSLATDRAESPTALHRGSSQQRGLPRHGRCRGPPRSNAKSRPPGPRPVATHHPMRPQYAGRATTARAHRASISGSSTYVGPRRRRRTITPSARRRQDKPATKRRLSDRSVRATACQGSHQRCRLCGPRRYGRGGSSQTSSLGSRRLPVSLRTRFGIHDAGSTTWWRSPPSRRTHWSVKDSTLLVA